MIFTRQPLCAKEAHSGFWGSRWAISWIGHVILTEQKLTRLQVKRYLGAERQGL